MNPLRSVCHPDRIEAYLDGVLDPNDQQRFFEHLERCEVCRSRLEQSAAKPHAWSEVHELLGDTRWHQQTGSEAFVRDPNELQATRIAETRHLRTVLDSLAPTDDPQMLGRVDGYEIGGVIGCGGMGAVLKGYDRSLNRVVAIKMMAPHLASSGAARSRFSREAQAAAAITHDNVVDIYGVAEFDGLPYLVMPYARGPSLQKRIDERGALPLVEVLRIGCQIAAGLAAAHDQGLVHRDIKPANILLSDGIDRLVITDFGLARAVDDASVTKTGVIAGTPQYMSPEQARGDAVDHRSDLFSLGSVLYTLCTGRIPFRGESAYGILRQITDHEPRPILEIQSCVPSWLCRVIRILHEKSAQNRYQSAQEVATVLQQCLAHVQNPGNPLPEQLQPKSESANPVFVGLIGATLLAVLSFLVLLGGFGKSDPPVSVTGKQSDPVRPSEMNAESILEVNSPPSLPSIETPSIETWNDAFAIDPARLLQRSTVLGEDSRRAFATGLGQTFLPPLPAIRKTRATFGSFKSVSVHETTSSDEITTMPDRVEATLHQNHRFSRETFETIRLQATRQSSDQWNVLIEAPGFTQDTVFQSHQSQTGILLTRFDSGANDRVEFIHLFTQFQNQSESKINRNRTNEANNCHYVARLWGRSELGRRHRNQAQARFRQLKDESPTRATRGSRLEHATQ